MKLRTMITGAILTLSLLAASATTAFAAVPRGRLEKVSDSAITGWAYNKDLHTRLHRCCFQQGHRRGSVPPAGNRGGIP